MKELSAERKIAVLQHLRRIETSLEYQTELIQDLQRALIFNRYDHARFLDQEILRYHELEGRILRDITDLKSGKDIEGKEHL